MAPKSDLSIWIDRYYRTVFYIEKQYTYFEKHLQSLRKQRTVEAIFKVILPVLASGAVVKYFNLNAPLLLPFFTLIVQIIIAFVSSQSIDKNEVLIELFLSKAGELRQKAANQFLIDLSRRDTLTVPYIANSIVQLRQEFNDLDLQILSSANIIYKSTLVDEAIEEASCYLQGLLTEEVSDFEKYGEESDTERISSNL